MRRCCFLSMDSLKGYVSDDELAIGPLRDLGWQVETVSWRDRRTDWSSFDSVVIRTTWDYQDSPEEFLETLRSIDSSGARLDNPLPIVKWNLDKRYLRDLESSGVQIVPTIFTDEPITSASFADWQVELDSVELIIKPTVSATAQDTFRLREFRPGLDHVFTGRTYMVQPFMPSIESEGEYSLFFFNGVYSHAILKSPKTGDFRVQEEHGGLITAIEPEPELLETAMFVNSLVPERTLYSRVDLVRTGLVWSLMELELIEPALYLRMNPAAPVNFAKAIYESMENRQ